MKTIRAWALVIFFAIMTSLAANFYGDNEPWVDIPLIMIVFGASKGYWWAMEKAWPS